VVELYMPYFNDGLLPTALREEEMPQRHLPACALSRIGRGRCDGGCKAHFEARDRAVHTPTPEDAHADAHADEEHRLAHVAATPARDKLVITWVETTAPGASRPMRPSPYLDLLQQERSDSGDELLVEMHKAKGNVPCS
jgi:superfamily I DNA/RNA helicase